VLVVCGKRGQLCNRLFPFANLVALAAEREVTIVNPGFGEYAPWFTGTASGALPRFPPRVGAGPRARTGGLAYRAASLAMRVDRRLRLVPFVALDDDQILDFDDPSGYAFVERLLGSPVALVDALYLLARESFVRHADLVRSYFAPVPAVATAAARCVERARAECEILIGVHVRQGDYRTQKPAFYHATERYVRLMTALAETFAPSRVGFLVCSDAPQPGEVFRSLRVSFGTGQPPEDLFALAGCDYIVGPPSTFSQWASFYGRVPRYVWEPAPAPAPPDEPPPRVEEFVVHEQGYGRFAGGPGSRVAKATP